MSEPLLDPKVLFGDAEHGACCGCCEGFCPEEDDPHSDGFEMLFSITVAGIEYLGTNKIQIRCDALAPLPEKVADRIAYPKVSQPWMVQPPAQRPPLDTRPQSARMLDRLDRSGITRHVGADVVHLYLGDQHVGWCNWSRHASAIVDDDLQLVRTLADATGLTLPFAAVALHTVRAASA
jgi:hypothetical protein